MGDKILLHPARFLVCSTSNVLHDLSLNRRKSDWFLSYIYLFSFSTKGIRRILKKKKKKKGNKKMIKKMKRLMEVVMQYEDSDGRILSEPFYKLPSRKELPDYYEIIRRPVDISKIQQRIDDDKYDDMDALEKDFMLMCKNTQQYNEDGSLIFEDSIVLQSVFTNARERLEQEPDEADDDDDSSRLDMDEDSRASSGSSARKKKEGRSSKKKKKQIVYDSDEDDDE